MKTQTAIVAAIATLACLTGVSVASATTGPGINFQLGVALTAKGINMTETLPRGTTVIVTAVNESKQVHDFSFLGKTTKPIKPGHRSQFTVILLHRGTFAYSSPLDKGKKGFHGTFTVT